MAPPSAPPPASSHPVLGATRARQGRYGRHVFWVLLISTVLAGVGLLAAWGWRSGDLASTEPHNARQAADAANFQAADPGPATQQK